jgi:hypothetical protein
MKTLRWKPLVISLLFIALVVTDSISPVTATSFRWQPQSKHSARRSKPYQSRSKGTAARLQVINHRNGTASLIFKFLNVPENFQVDRILMRVRQAKPVSPVQGSPAEQVKAAYYTAQISSTTFDQREPEVNADIRMYHNPKEPYALAVVCLWYSRPNSHVEFKVKPKYFDARGREIIMTTEPQEGVVVLENRSTVSPVDLRTEPSGDSSEPTCNDRNAGRKD